jgi:hypothetical protein
MAPKSRRREEGVIVSPMIEVSDRPGVVEAALEEGEDTSGLLELVIRDRRP